MVVQRYGVIGQTFGFWWGRWVLPKREVSPNGRRLHGDKVEALSNADPWNLLQSGDAAQGLAVLRQRHAKIPSPSHIMELGVAYMWVRDYAAALKHFQYSIRTDRRASEYYYRFAGAAAWCLGSYSSAVESWHAGLDARYANAGVCIRSAMVLLLTSILRPVLFSRKEAEDILLQKAKDPRLAFWPGTLGQFIAGQIDAATLEESWVGNLSRTVRGVMPHARWLTGFYKVVLEFGDGRLSLGDLRRAMKAMVEISQPEWYEHLNFVHLLWNEEFFIARHEAQTA